MTPPDATPADREALAMPPEQWAHVRALIEETLTLPREARPAFLGASCGGDEILKRQVERLVAACERAGEPWGFLEQSAGQLAAPLLGGKTPRAATAQLGRLSAALVDRYRIERVLGAGGMATVYLAHDVRHERQVAIKMLHPELSAMLGVERFLSEIKTTAALQHPHILPLFDSGTADGLLFYVMPLVEGGTLRARLTREQQLPVADAVRIAGEIGGALDYAHRRGVIHRDVKPENILLHEGRPVIADFGIAIAAESAGAERMTQPGTSLGTPQYMSPEQTTGERQVTARSDIYALGAVLYEMLTGEPPFTGPTVGQIAARVRTEEPRAITTQRKQVPAHVEAAVLTALAKLPADRFESAGEFARALSDPGFRATTRTRSAIPRIERRAYGTLLVSLGAVAIGVVGAWAWRRTTDAPMEVVRFALMLPRDLSIAPKSAQGATLAVSPDGKSVVFVGTGSDGTRRLYARALNQIVPRMLPGTDGGSQPFYSPDGRWIGFESEGRLQKLQVEGGLPQTVTASPGIVGATWAPNDIIVYSDGVSLLSVPASGGTPKLLSAPDRSRGETSYLFPMALDDGDHVLYSSAGTGGVEGTTIGVASLSARSGRSLGIHGVVPLGVVDGRLIYATPDNTLMSVPFDVSTGQATAAPVVVARDVTVTSFGSAKAALSLSGTLAYLSGERESRMVLANKRNEIEVVLPEARAYSFPRFSPDGKRIAVSIGSETRSDVWVYDLASNTPVRLSSGGSVNERPEWTPDGARVVYRADAGERSSIWWRPADLSGPAVSLIRGAQGFWEGVITPDGRSIIVQADVDIAVRALASDAPPTNIAASEATETQPRVSPDGRWLAFVTDESGSDQVVVQPFPAPGARVQVSSSGGTEPVWSRDGRRLFYRANKKFMVATMTGGPKLAVASREPFLDDRFVSAAAPHANYDVSLDGKRLLVLEAAEEPQILVIYNWAAEVRGRLRPP